VWVGFGFRFLSQHDTESGHLGILTAAGIVVIAAILGSMRRHSAAPSNVLARPWTTPRLARLALIAWFLPLASLGVAMLEHENSSGLVQSGRFWPRPILARWRFLETPADDIERLAVWCRENTPATARFIGPPGPKTFRLWSRRSLAFNRSGSPYHGRGLADWFARFQDHVGFRGSADTFVSYYQRHRHEVEARYEMLDARAKALLAIRQGATYLIAEAPEGKPASHPLNVAGGDSASVGREIEPLHTEGKYAVYRVSESFARSAEAAAAGLQTQR
jgi:hypothetical protein